MVLDQTVRLESIRPDLAAKAVVFHVAQDSFQLVVALGLFDGFQLALQDAHGQPLVLLLAALD